MQYRIEVIHKKEWPDPAGLSALADIRDLGVEAARDVRAVDVFLVDGTLDPARSNGTGPKGPASTPSK